MADDGVADDDESKIVTKFLIDTCRLKQTSRHRVHAALLYVCGHVSKETCDVIPLITGSAAEFYIQPMLSCIGDVDIMFHFSNELAVPDGRQPPSKLPHTKPNRCGVTPLRVDRIAHPREYMDTLLKRCK